MTITKVQEANNVTVSGSTVTTTLGATATANNLLVTFGSANSTLVLNDPSGWAVAVAGEDGGGGVEGKIWWKTSNGTETGVTVTTTVGGRTINAQIVEISGFSTWALDKTNTNDPAGSGTTCGSGASGTLTSAAEVVIAAVAAGTSTIPTWDSGFTALGGGGGEGGASYLITAATTSVSSTASWVGSGPRIGMIATFMAGATPATPATWDMPLAEPSPTIAVDSAAGPTAVAQVLAEPAPTLTASANETPTTWDMPLAVPAPSFTISNAITPSTWDMPLAVPAPSVIVGTIAFPTEVAMPLAVPAPVLTYDMTVFPTEVQQFLADPGAAPTTLVTANPTTIPLTFAPILPSLFTSPDGIVTLIGRFTDDNGLPSTGLLRFAMPITLLNTTTQIRYPPTWVEVTLDATGSFQIQLPATDVAAFTPTDRVWEVTEWVDQKARTYTIPLTSSPPIQYLATLAPQT